MSVPATSLTMNSFVVNSLNLFEQLQNVSIKADLTTVDARGIADRYTNEQATKRKQTVDFMAHWYNSTSSLEATNLDVTLWTLGGTALIADVKSGSIDITNSGPEVSGIAVLDEFMVPTNTKIVIATELMVVSEALFSDQVLGASTVAGFETSGSITFAGEPFAFASGLVTGTVHDVKRGEVQMENVTITVQGAPTTTGDTTSLLYLASIGSAITNFSIDTGANVYAAASTLKALITKLNMRFADKALIAQNISLQMQGAMTVTAGS